ncbi:MAG: tellurite resistance TerB C-terminal domain-containing protein [Bulleidia sp.]
MKQAHLMVSVAADAVNEKLFEEFGDSVILFEGDEPLIAEDYAEELKKEFSD